MVSVGCDSDDDGGGAAEGSTSEGGVDDDDAPVDDDGEETTGADTDVEPTTGGDTDPEATTSADTDPAETTGQSFPEDCSCYNPAATGPLPEDGCLDFADIYLGCDAPAEDCGTFTTLWDSELAESEPSKADNAALDCIIATLGEGGAAGFTATSPPEDMYGGHSEYSPLPGGGYGSYNCNTTNGGANNVTIYAAPVAEDMAACADAADYFEKVSCVLDAMVDADDPSMLACE